MAGQSPIDQRVPHEKLPPLQGILQPCLMTTDAPSVMTLVESSQIQTQAETVCDQLQVAIVATSGMLYLGKL